MEFNKHVQAREEKFGTVIFETLKEKVFVTNPTGAEIIKLIQKKKSQKEIIEELSQTYGATESAIATDVNQFIDNLAKNEIIL